MGDRIIDRALYSTGFPPPALEGGAFSRLYLGHEFCFNRIPPIRRLEEAREWAAERGIGFSLVTPILDEEGLEGMGSLLNGFDPREGDEIVVNDVGFLEILKGRWTPVLGRLLTRQRRGAAWKASLPSREGALRFLRGALDSPGVVEWFRDRYGILRFEIDNLIQGVETRDLPGDVRLSVYHPWLVLTVTRHCPWRFDGRRWKMDEPCASPCREEELVLNPARDGRAIRLGGMAQFLENDSAEIYAGPSVDRWIYQPRIPA